MRQNSRIVTNIMMICGRKIGYGEKPFVVAEAGVNHNGDLDLALRLIDEASLAGADAVKFQTFEADQVVTAFGEMADYQKRNLGIEESQLKMVKKLELRSDLWPVLIKRAKKRKIILFSSPHGHIVSADLLQRLHMPAFKIGSGDLTNIPLLKHVAGFKKPIILGTGMSNLTEIKEAIYTIKKAGNNKIIILHCTTDYPLSPKDVNLSAMRTLMQEFDVLVGYSDHTVGPQTAVMAVTLGACLIEKHFTLDKSLPGPDQIGSMEPKEFREMVDQIHLTTVIMGHPQKKLLNVEKQYVTMVRKSLVATCDIKRGEKITSAAITVKRPGTGLSPKYYEEIIGKIARRDIKKDNLIKKSDINV